MIDLYQLEDLNRKLQAELDSGSSERQELKVYLKQTKIQLKEVEAERDRLRAECNR